MTRRPGARILLVDDEEAIQKLLRFPLEKEGYQVVQARDGQEALDAFARETFDLVILDIMMPRVDGMEVCRRLRAVSTVPIIMLTAKADEFDKVLGLEIGADDYITKDRFSLREFRSRVRAQLRRAEMARQAEAARARTWSRSTASRSTCSSATSTYAAPRRPHLHRVRAPQDAHLPPGPRLQPPAPAAARVGRLGATATRAPSTCTSAICARRSRRDPKQPRVHLHRAQHRLQVPRVLGRTLEVAVQRSRHRVRSFVVSAPRAVATRSPGVSAPCRGRSRTGSPSRPGVVLLAIGLA